VHLRISPRAINIFESRKIRKSTICRNDQRGRFFTTVRVLMQAINIKLFRKYPRKRADKGGRNKSMPQGSSGSSEYNYPTKHTIKIK
jgi:hypothetical protein